MEKSEELKELLNHGYRYALALTKSEDLAFDLAQDAYLKIVEAEAPLKKPYYLKVIRNKFLDNQKRKKVKLKWFQSHHRPTVQDEQYTVEPNLEKEINKLPEKNREILILSVVQDYTAQEIADHMEVPRGTVLSILKRTKDKLKIILNEKIDVS